jgi:hypothetical protein
MSAVSCWRWVRNRDDLIGAWRMGKRNSAGKPDRTLTVHALPPTARFTTMVANASFHDAEPVLIAGGWRAAAATSTFYAIDPSTGLERPQSWPVSEWSDVEAAIEAATDWRTLVQNRHCLLRGVVDTQLLELVAETGLVSTLHMPFLQLIEHLLAYTLQLLELLHRLRAYCQGNCLELLTGLLSIVSLALGLALLFCRHRRNHGLERLRGGLLIGLLALDLVVARLFADSAGHFVLYCEDLGTLAMTLTSLNFISSKLKRLGSRGGN